MDIFNKKPTAPQKIHIISDDSKVLILDEQRINWVVVSEKIASIILLCDGSKTIIEIINELNLYNDQIFYQKLLSCFEKLYDLNFFSDTDINIIKQSETLDSIYFNLTKNCNLNCIYCYTNAGTNALSSIGEKPLEFWKKAIDQLYLLNKKATINITGGEPTLYKSFWNVAEYAKYKNINLLLITNGTTLKRINLKRYLEFFNSIEISIDSLREDINSLTRGKGSLSNARKFIDLLIEHGVKPTIMVVVSENNKNYIYEIYNQYNSFANIKYQPMYKMGRGNSSELTGITAKEYYDILKSKNIKRMKGDVSYIRNMKYNWCGMGRNVLSIEANGVVYPCQLMHHQKFKLGDLNNQPIEEIWLNSPYRNNSVDMIEGCKDCELKYICSAPCRARAFYVLGSIYKKDPLCPDFIKNSIIDNLFEA